MVDVEGARAFPLLLSLTCFPGRFPGFRGQLRAFANRTALDCPLTWQPPSRSLIPAAPHLPYPNLQATPSTTCCRLHHSLPPAPPGAAVRCRCHALVRHRHPGRLLPAGGGGGAQGACFGAGWQQGCGGWRWSGAAQESLGVLLCQHENAWMHGRHGFWRAVGSGQQLGSLLPPCIPGVGSGSARRFRRRSAPADITLAFLAAAVRAPRVWHPRRAHAQVHHCARLAQAALLPGLQGQELGDQAVFNINKE